MMTFFRKVTRSELLANVMDIPEDLRNKEVEIIVIPCDKKTGVLLDKNLKDGSRPEHPGLAHQDKDAWANAAVEQYLNLLTL